MNPPQTRQTPPDDATNDAPSTTATPNGKPNNHPACAGTTTATVNGARSTNTAPTAPNTTRAGPER